MVICTITRIFKCLQKLSCCFQISYKLISSIIVFFFTFTSLFLVWLWNQSFLIFRLRITQLETELARRDQEFRAQEFQLHQLQRELEAKLSQINKLQDAIGYTNGLGHSPPPVSLPHFHPRFSVINQGPSRFQRVAVEVHRRLKAKEGVSAEPTSENFCQEVKAAHVSKAVPKDSQ